VAARVSSSRLGDASATNADVGPTVLGAVVGVIVTSPGVGTVPAAPASTETDIASVIPLVTSPEYVGVCVALPSLNTLSVVKDTLARLLTLWL